MHFLHSLQLKSASGCPVSVWCSAKTKREGTVITFFLMTTVKWKWNKQLSVFPFILLWIYNQFFGQEWVNLSLCIKSYWQANMKSCGHPAQDGWIQVLGTVSCSHHHHLWLEVSQWKTLIKSKIIADQQVITVKIELSVIGNRKTSVKPLFPQSHVHKQKHIQILSHSFFFF